MLKAVDLKDHLDIEIIVEENQWFNLIAPRSLTRHLEFMFRKNIQISMGMKCIIICSTHKFHMVTLNGLKTSDCHRCLKFMFRKIIQISIGMKFIIICQLYQKFHMVTGKWYENFRLSPSEHVTIWKNYSLSYQYEHVTIWFVTKCILFIPVTILVWNFKMVTGMNSSYQAFIWWHLSPYGGLVWKIFIPVTKKAVQMVTVWEVLP